MSSRTLSLRHSWHTTHQQQTWAAGVVVVEERPDLEVQRNALITQSVENARRLLAVEDRILEVLLSSQHPHAVDRH